ncbi:MAG: hypothetical protein EA403_15535 [Spirochaetaceae bacterium]|nr:MAG: hypothetical protein EA403_15535 [Spirochaetaceae bacterium]
MTQRFDVWARGAKRPPRPRAISIILALVVALLVVHQSGCSVIDDLLHMQSLRVIAYEPAHRFVSAADAAAVSVRFSQPAHRVHTEQAFSLEDSRGTVAGQFTWSGGGDRLEFRPHHGFRPGESYSVRMSTRAEDLRGNALDRELQFSFLLRTHDSRPVVVDEDVMVHPTGELHRLEVEFSVPMARDRMIEALSVTPSVRFTIQWLNEDHRIALSPSEPLLPGTSYSVKIAASATCRDGNSLAGDHVVYVSTPDRSVPAVVAITTNPGGIQLTVPADDGSAAPPAGDATPPGVDATDGFVLQFTAPVPVEMRPGIAQFAPTVPAVLEWNSAMDTVTVTPRQPLVPGRRYELRVQERRYPFTVTGPPVPSLSGLAFSAHLGEYEHVLAVDGAVLTLIPGAPLNTRTDHAALDVRITHAKSATIPIASFLQSLRLAARNGTVSFTVRAVERDPADSPLAVTATDTTRDSVLRVHLSISRTGIEPFDLVTMELRSGLTDDLGNRLAVNEGRLMNAR